MSTPGGAVRAKNENAADRSGHEAGLADLRQGTPAEEAVLEIMHYVVLVDHEDIHEGRDRVLSKSTTKITRKQDDDEKVAHEVALILRPGAWKAETGRREKPAENR